MKWTKEQERIIDDDNGFLVAILPDNKDELRDKLIELAPEMLNTIMHFVEAIESGNFRAKSAYNKMKDLISKFPKYVIEDERVQIQ